MTLCVKRRWQKKERSWGIEDEVYRLRHESSKVDYVQRMAHLSRQTQNQFRL